MKEQLQEHQEARQEQKEAGEEMEQEVDVELLEQEFSKAINICSALISNTRKQNKEIEEMEIKFEILTEK